ncbi:Hypothetical protein J6898_04767 [Nakaseomyces glabratus]
MLGAPISRDTPRKTRSKTQFFQGPIVSLITEKWAYEWGNPSIN